MMHEPALAVGVIALVCMFGGALGGMFVRTRLPEHHRRKETEDVVKVGTNVITIASALVIGLLIASAKTGFDTKDTELKRLAGNLILLDRNLARYGPQTTEAREFLRRYTVDLIDSTWPQEAVRPAESADGWRLLEAAQDLMRGLVPANDAQRWLQARVLSVSGEIAQARWLLHVQTGAVLPKAFLVVLVLWLTIIFSSFGLFAPPNTTTVTALFVCAFSLAAAIVLIVSMSNPFSGIIHISSAPMREALAFLGR
jgi:hypothetical protein